MLLRSILQDLIQLQCKNLVFGFVYEEILRELQSAGSSGEFYTPRAVTEFMALMIKPKLGEKMADFACGTGGFITSWLGQLSKQVTDTSAQKQLDDSIYGIEKKPFPYLLCVTNMLLHDIEVPNIYHMNSLKHNLLDYTDADKFDVILMNPPYGGHEDKSIQGFFPDDLASSETADLFMSVILYRLKKNGRAAVVVPDGFLFGLDNAKVNIKKKLIGEFNLHTVVRLPSSVFSPYTSITTNLLFFDNTKPTTETWFYRVDIPSDRKHFSKTKPMELKHFDDCISWWNNREVIPDGEYFKAQKFTADWIVDDEAAAVVRQIFAWCMEGYGPSQIAKKLREAKVDCPTVHWMKMGRNAPANTPDDPYAWAPRTITGILEKMEYLGHMVNFKTRKQSYRSKKKLENSPDQWKIFENTHEAIIDEETFARVQELRKNKRRPARTGKTNMFSGLVRCADCGEKLYYCTSNSFETRQDHFVCSTSRKKGKEVCDTHFIRAVVLEEGTLQHMRLVIQCVADYEDAFRRALGAKRSEEAKIELSAKKRTLQKSENRLAELDRLFKRIYEDMVNGKLSDARFQMLSDDYEQEQAELRAKIEMLENEIRNQEDQAENVDRFIRQAKKYLYLEKLTPTILNDMVNAVYVHAPDKSSGHRVQDVTISYNYIGILPANLLYDVMNGKAA